MSGCYRLSGCLFDPLGVANPLDELPLAGYKFKFMQEAYTLASMQELQVLSAIPKPKPDKNPFQDNFFETYHPENDYRTPHFHPENRPWELGTPFFSTKSRKNPAQHPAENPPADLQRSPGNPNMTMSGALTVTWTSQARAPFF